MKEGKKLLQKHKHCTKGKVHIMNFSDEENVLILCISGSKRRSFSRQEIDKKIFL